jgi:hypothetical protein
MLEVIEMNGLKAIGLAGAILVLSATAAMADTAKSQARASQVYNLQQKAARQQANATKAEENGNSARASELEQKSQQETTEADQAYATRKAERVQASQENAYRAMRDEQKANHDANIGDTSQADALRHEASIRQQHSNNIRTHYGKKADVYNPATGHS